MQRKIKLQRPVVLSTARLLLKHPWLVVIIGATTVFIMELAEHWHQPEIFDAHFWVELTVYGLVIPLVVWGLLKWLARTLMVDLPTKRVHNDASLAERQRIARDLHDSLAQNLAYLHLKLDQLHATNDASLTEIVSIQDELAHMRQIADDAYEQVRATLNDLRSDTAIPIDLQAQLRTYATEIVQKKNPAIAVTCSVNASLLCQIVKRTVLNISQEALNNVVKHAQASQVTIRLATHQSDTILTITDNGKGISLPDKDSHNGHYGLEIMRERAEEIGGQLAITSAPDRGTTIEARFPNTVVSEALLQTCARLECNLFDTCQQALKSVARQQESPAEKPPHATAAPHLGRTYEHPSG